MNVTRQQLREWPKASVFVASDNGSTLRIDSNFDTVADTPGCTVVALVDRDGNTLGVFKKVALDGQNWTRFVQ